MKLHRLTHISLLIATSLFLPSCGKTPQVTPENARTAAFMACAGVVTFVPEADKAHVCDYIWSIAHGLRTLSGGRVPTPQEVQDMIAQFAPNGGKWSNLGTSIAMLWSGIYPKINGDGKLGLQYIEAVAGGCEDFATGCKTTP